MMFAFKFKLERIWFWPLIVGFMAIFFFPIDHPAFRYFPIVCFLLSGVFVGGWILQNRTKEETSEAALTPLRRVALVIVPAAFVFLAYLLGRFLD